VIEEALELAEEDFERMALSMPTQYEILTQKLVIQSFETAGFHLRKSACEILKAVSTEKHESPDLTVYQRLTNIVGHDIEPVDVRLQLYNIEAF